MEKYITFMDWKKYKDVRKKMEATKISIDRSIDKEDVVYSYTIECYLAKKRTKYLFFFAAVWTDLLSQAKTNIIWYHLYVESKL